VNQSACCLSASTTRRAISSETRPQLTNISTGQRFSHRSDDLVSNLLLDDGDLLAGEGVLPHERVHGWEEVGRRRRRESSKEGGRDVVADSSRDLG